MEPTYDEGKNVIYYPLVPLDHTRLRMEVTICHFLMEHGYTLKGVKDNLAGIPEDWTKKAIYDYVEKYGKAKYPDGHLDR